MRAAVLNAPHDLQLVNKDQPTAGPGEVVLKVEANTLCGTDYRLFTGAKTSGVRAGVVPGHEVAGSVCEIGEGVEQYYPDLKVGDQATISIVVSCGYCTNCLHDREQLCSNLTLFGYALDGGLEEYLRVPARAVARGNLFPTTKRLTPKALCLSEPISCCLNGLDQYRVHAGDTVVILGAGPIGLLHLQLALLQGAAQVIVSNRGSERRATVERLGGVGVHPDDLPHEVQARTAGMGADVVVVCIGAVDLANDALELAHPGGRVNYFAGFPKGSTSVMEPNLIHYKELQVTGGSNARRRDVARAVALLESGVIAVDEIVTHQYPLADIHDAYEAVRARKGVKIAVIP
ncbi:alcohol dehydrogenase catalytic domain-containing protein [Gleimia hominis]|uniref:Alcohol dehydrogenase catalytic domain-containing protein n=1 Tax=Gleimia hominis TaxID=595468 RepID=A0ABU3I900_9ACTO|nr:alcohol dehydrogenase catalytic domain-containing protein [Gleimia hominis]MDT3766841.1 alcohol dehydrogenase catalytic domain-containing protein [Gleimia hominis]